MAVSRRKLGLLISDKIREKLSNKTPPVTEEEILQCFANQDRSFLVDTREEHKTNPLTKWFVAETDYGRKLKIMFVHDARGIHIKSAYGADQIIVDLYNKYSRPL